MADIAGIVDGKLKDLQTQAAALQELLAPRTVLYALNGLAGARYGRDETEAEQSLTDEEAYEAILRIIESAPARPVHDGIENKEPAKAPEPVSKYRPLEHEIATHIQGLAEGLAELKSDLCITTRRARDLSGGRSGF